MKKLFIPLIVMVILLTGCNTAKLTDDFDEVEVKNAAAYAISLMNERDYQGISDLVRDDCQESLSADVLSGVCDEVLDKAGDFDSITKQTVVGGQNEDRDEDFAISVSTCKYAEMDISYTFVYDANMEIVGVYMQ